MYIEVLKMNWPKQVLEEVAKGHVYARCSNGVTFEQALQNLILNHDVDSLTAERAFRKGRAKALLYAVSNGFGDTNLPDKNITYYDLLKAYSRHGLVDEEEAHLAIAKARKLERAQH